MTQLSNNNVERRDQPQPQIQQMAPPPPATGISSRPKTTASVSSIASAGASSTHSAGGGAGAECVKVVVRCRPLSAVESAQGHSCIVQANSARASVELRHPNDAQNLPAKCFAFDAVFDEESKQLDVYDEAVRNIVDSVLQGFNGTVFAYGQTGTGKTYTMEGARGDAERRGVIPNAIEHIFQHIAHSPPSQQYLVRASFLEIYQEEIRDLLNRSAGKRLELRERPDIGVYVKELSSFVTKSVEEIEHVMSVGHSNRSVGRTNMNEHSSRSHAIFIVTVECAEEGPDGEKHIRVGRLNLVDLAGSERQAKSGAEGQRLREASKINLSLSALGNVISALADHHSAHVPYRDSKLTRLLQDSLGGTAKTVMIANIGPASYNFEETMSTLRYASRAKHIENRPKINEDPKDALLREFQDEIARLKAMLEERRRGSAAGRQAESRQRMRTRRKGGGDEAEEGKENNSGNSSMMDGSTVSAEKEAEEYAREQQLKLEMERERLLRNGEIIEEERRRILAELEERGRELEREREAQLAVAAKIRAMQSKLLSGDGNLLDRTRRQEELLRQRRSELAEQRRRERELAQRLECQELEAAEIRHTYANLQQEVEAKRRKLHKLHTKLQSIRLDLQDGEGANAAERHGLEQTVLEMNKELALKWLIIDNFVPVPVAEHVRTQARFDDAEQRWTLAAAAVPSTSSTYNTYTTADGRIVERLNLMALSPNPLVGMADSGLGSSGGSQGPAPSNADDEQQQMAPSTSSEGPKVPLELKRPMAFAGARRPISAFELGALAKLRQRLSRQRPAIASIAGSGKVPPDLSIPDEVLRFGCENLLTFHSLIGYPSEVRTELVESRRPPSAALNPQRIVLDASRIPVLAKRRGSTTMMSGSSRPGSATGSRRSSLARSAISIDQHSNQQNQNSKNARARSVFSNSANEAQLARTTSSSSAVKSIASGGGGGGRIPAMYPKARGLVGGRAGGKF